MRADFNAKRRVANITVAPIVLNDEGVGFSSKKIEIGASLGGLNCPAVGTFSCGIFVVMF